MALFRYLFGTLWCLFVWLCTAIIVGTVISLIFPPPGGHAFVGIVPDLRNLPGTILGFLAAVQSWRKHVRKPVQTPPKTAPNESADITAPRTPIIKQVERVNEDPY